VDGLPSEAENGSGELEGIGSAERMDPQEAPRRLEHRLDGLDTVPGSGQSI